jgi:transposase
MEKRNAIAPTTVSDSATAYVAIELSALSWLVAVRRPGSGKVSLYKLAAGDWARLVALSERARGLGASRVLCCYEAGRDGFWLHRQLAARGIDCLVLDPASLPVNRRARRAKSDRIDVHMLLRGLMGWDGGDRDACRPVRVPTPGDEDARQTSRERAALLKERVRHVNRIKALLATQGVIGFEPLHAVRTGGRTGCRIGGGAGLAALTGVEGAALPAGLVARLERELARLELVVEQIAAVEAVRDEAIAHLDDAAGDAAALKAARLVALKGIGPQIATVLAREVFYRAFDNRRELASYTGLCPSPWRSGGMVREQGVSKAGNARARSCAIEMAWLWLRWQPKSALSLWFTRRVGAARGRLRRIAIVALARKLMVALWRYVETGLVPDGAVLKA